jgi:AcrR family transcriptional regulator
MATPVETVDPRPQRADARRNRELILAAAKTVFAKHGNDAQMDDIARKAKLGVGTLYRHFPTKDALVRALIADRVSQIVAFVKEGLEDPDPFHGLSTSLWRGAELAARDRGLSQTFAGQMDEFGEAHKERTDLFESSSELVRRAQAAGTLRADFRTEDIPVIMCGVFHAMHHMAPDPRTPGPWQRHLRLMIDGMRAPAAVEPLPPPGR